MRMTLLIATATALISVSSLAHADLIGVTSISGGANFPSFNGTDQTIGFSFSSATSISVTALGYYDQTPDDALSQSHEVGIWNTSGTLLMSVTVDPTDPLTGSFRYHAVTPVELIASATYVIGAAITSPFSDPYNIPGSLTTSPDITLLGSARNASSGGFSDPSTVTAGNGRFGPNFQYVEATVDVPEPMSLALLGSGLFRSRLDPSPGGLIPVSRTRAFRQTTDALSSGGSEQRGSKSGCTRRRVTVVGRMRARCFFRWWCEYEAMRWRGSETAEKCSCLTRIKGHSGAD